MSAGVLTCSVVGDVAAAAMAQAKVASRPRWSRFHDPPPSRLA
ncbi:MAG: hypothetical protein U0802_01900 [Candidatus Binatia bacterium]